jgi:hypothetical protein
MRIDARALMVPLRFAAPKMLLLEDGHETTRSAR